LRAAYADRVIRRLRYQGTVAAPKPITPATTNSHHQLLVVPADAVGALGFLLNVTGAAVGVRVTVAPWTSTCVATSPAGAGGGGIDRSACCVEDGRATEDWAGGMTTG